MLSPRENALIAYRHGQPEYVPCFFTDIAMGQAAPFIERPVGTQRGGDAGYDAWGVHWTYDPQTQAAIPTPNRYLFEEMEDWREYVKFPDLDSIDWEKQAEEDKLSTLMGVPEGMDPAQFREGKLKVCMIIQGMFERMHSFMGFENALMALAAEPEECFDFFSAMADYKIAYLKKIAQYYDYEVVEMHDDYGSQDRLFMSPETWRKLIKPNLKRIVDAAHELGFIYQHHSCGHVEELIDDFIELGMDAVDTWQAACNPHIAELKKDRLNKITICGGFDNTHVLDNVYATEDQIRSEYHRAIDSLAPGGSYVIFPITATFGFIPTLIDEHFKYGMGFYQNPVHRRENGSN